MAEHEEIALTEGGAVNIAQTYSYQRPKYHHSANPIEPPIVKPRETYQEIIRKPEASVDERIEMELKKLGIEESERWWYRAIAERASRLDFE